MNYHRKNAILLTFCLSLVVFPSHIATAAATSSVNKEKMPAEEGSTGGKTEKSARDYKHMLKEIVLNNAYARKAAKHHSPQNEERRMEGLQDKESKPIGSVRGRGRNLNSIHFGAEDSSKNDPQEELVQTSKRRILQKDSEGEDILAQSITDQQGENQHEANETQKDASYGGGYGGYVDYGGGHDGGYGDYGGGYDGGYGGGYGGGYDGGYGGGYGDGYDGGYGGGYGGGHGGRNYCPTRCVDAIFHSKKCKSWFGDCNRYFGWCGGVSKALYPLMS